MTVTMAILLELDYFSSIQELRRLIRSLTCFRKSKGGLVPKGRLFFI